MDGANVASLWSTVSDTEQPLTSSFRFSQSLDPWYKVYVRLRPAINSCPEWSAQKWTALSTSVNEHKLDWGHKNCGRSRRRRIGWVNSGRVFSCFSQYTTSSALPPQSPHHHWWWVSWQSIFQTLSLTNSSLFAPSCKFSKSSTQGSASLCVCDELWIKSEWDVIMDGHSMSWFRSDLWNLLSLSLLKIQKIKKSPLLYQFKP